MPCLSEATRKQFSNFAFLAALDGRMGGGPLTFEASSMVARSLLPSPLLQAGQSNVLCSHNLAASLRAWGPGRQSFPWSQRIDTGYRARATVCESTLRSQSERCRDREERKRNAGAGAFK